MKPISFTKHETVFVGQSKDVAPLPAKVVMYDDGRKGIVSCWKVNAMEILRLVFTRRIYLCLLGSKQPPVLLTIDPSEVGAVDNPEDRQFEVDANLNLGEVDWTSINTANSERKSP